MGTTPVSVDDYIKNWKPSGKDTTPASPAVAASSVSVDDYIKNWKPPAPSPDQSTSRLPAPSAHDAIADYISKKLSPAQAQATAAPPALTGAYAHPFIPGGIIGPTNAPSNLIQQPIDAWASAMGVVRNVANAITSPIPPPGVEPWRDPVAEAAARQERAGFQPGTQIGPGGSQRQRDIDIAAQRAKGGGFVEGGTIGPRKLSESEAAAAERLKAGGFVPGTSISPKGVVPPNRVLPRENLKRMIDAEHGPVLNPPLGKITDPIMQGAAGRIFGGNPEAYLAEGQKTPNMLRFESLVPPDAPPEVKAATEFASGLTSPDNALILVATGGVGAIEGGLGKHLMGRLISLGFSADMLHGAYGQLREANEAAKSGDMETARRLLTHGVLGGVMGALALKHFVKGDPQAKKLAEGESKVDLVGTRRDMAEALVKGRRLVKRGQQAAEKTAEPPPEQAAPAAASVPPVTSKEGGPSARPEAQPAQGEVIPAVSQEGAPPAEGEAPKPAADRRLTLTPWPADGFVPAFDPDYDPILEKEDYGPGMLWSSFHRDKDGFKHSYNVNSVENGIVTFTDTTETSQRGKHREVKSLPFDDFRQSVERGASLIVGRDEKSGGGAPAKAAETPSEAPPAPAAEEPPAPESTSRPLAKAETPGKGDSWMIVDKATGRVQREAYNPKVVDAIDHEKYVAVPAEEYLQEFNKRVKAAGGEQPPDAPWPTTEAPVTTPPPGEPKAKAKLTPEEKKATPPIIETKSAPAAEGKRAWEMTEDEFVAQRKAAFLAVRAPGKTPDTMTLAKVDEVARKEYKRKVAAHEAEAATATTPPPGAENYSRAMDLEKQYGLSAQEAAVFNAALDKLGTGGTQFSSPAEELQKAALKIAVKSGVDLSKVSGLKLARRILEDHPEFGPKPAEATTTPPGAEAPEVEAAFDKKKDDQLAAEAKTAQKRITTLSKAISKTPMGTVPPAITRELNDSRAKEMDRLEKRVAEIAKEREGLKAASEPKAEAPVTTTPPGEEFPEAKLEFKKGQEWQSGQGTYRVLGMTADGKVEYRFSPPIGRNSVKSTATPEDFARLMAKYTELKSQPKPPKVKGKAAYTVTVEDGYVKVQHPQHGTVAAAPYDEKTGKMGSLEFTDQKFQEANAIRQPAIDSLKKWQTERGAEVKTTTPPEPTSKLPLNPYGAAKQMIASEMTIASRESPLVRSNDSDIYFEGGHWWQREPGEVDWHKVTDTATNDAIEYEMRKGTLKSSPEPKPEGNELFPGAGVTSRQKIWTEDGQVTVAGGYGRNLKTGEVSVTVKLPKGKSVTYPLDDIRQMIAEEDQWRPKGTSEEAKPPKATEPPPAAPEAVKPTEPPVETPKVEPKPAEPVAIPARSKSKDTDKGYEQWVKDVHNLSLSTYRDKVPFAPSDLTALTDSQLEDLKSAVDEAASWHPKVQPGKDLIFTSPEQAASMKWWDKQKDDIKKEFWRRGEPAREAERQANKAASEKKAQAEFERATTVRPKSPTVKDVDAQRDKDVPEGYRVSGYSGGQRLLTQAGQFSVYQTFDTREWAWYDEKVGPAKATKERYQEGVKSPVTQKYIDDETAYIYGPWAEERGVKTAEPPKPKAVTPSVERYEEIQREVSALQKSKVYAEDSREGMMARDRALELQDEALIHRDVAMAKYQADIDAEKAARKAEEAKLAPQKAAERPYVSSADLAEHYKAQGMDRQAAWKQYVKDTVLSNAVRSDKVGAPAFMAAYDKITPGTERLNEKLETITLPTEATTTAEPPKPAAEGKPSFTRTTPAKGTPERTKLEADYEAGSTKQSAIWDEQRKLETEIAASKYGSKKREALEKKLEKNREQERAASATQEPLRKQSYLASLEDAAEQTENPILQMAARYGVEEQNLKALQGTSKFDVIRQTKHNEDFKTTHDAIRAELRKRVDDADAKDIDARTKQQIEELTPEENKRAVESAVRSVATDYMTTPLRADDIDRSLRGSLYGEREDILKSKFWNSLNDLAAEYDKVTGTQSSSGTGGRAFRELRDSVDKYGKTRAEALDAGRKLIEDAKAQKQNEVDARNKVTEERSNSVRPLSEMKVPAINETAGSVHVWDGNSVKGGNLASDGSLMVDLTAIKDKTRRAQLSKQKPGAGNPSETAKKIWDQVAKSAKTPLEDVGYITDKGVERALYAKPDGTVIALGGKKARFLQSALGFDEVRGSDAGKPVAIYRDGKMVGVLSPYPFTGDIDLGIARESAKKPLASAEPPGVAAPIEEAAPAPAPTEPPVESASRLPEQAPAAGAPKKTALELANEARKNKHLNEKVQTKEYGVVTRGEWIKRRVEAGGRIEEARVPDDALRKKVQAEYDQMKNSSDWVPTGNPNHPRTIKYNALKAQLEGEITKPEYRLYNPADPEAFRTISKTDYDYARSVEAAKSEAVAPTAEPPVSAESTSRPVEQTPSVESRTATPPGAPLVAPSILEKLVEAGKESDKWLHENGILGGESLSANRILDPQAVYHLTRSVVGDVARGAITIEEAAKKVWRTLRRTFDTGALTLQDVQKQIQDHIDKASALSELTSKIGKEQLSPAPAYIPENLRQTRAAWGKLGKDVAAAWDKTQEVAQKLWADYRNKTPWTSFDDAVGRYDGQLQFGSNEAMDFVDAIHKAIPDKLRREGLVNYAQANGDMALLEQRAKASTTYRPGYEAAMRLNPAEQNLAKQVRTYFNQRLDDAQKEGMLKDGVENYVNQIWERNPEEARKLYAAAAFHELEPNPAFLHKRFFETYFEGEQAGFTPRDKDIGSLIAIYDQSFNSAIASRRFIDTLHEGVASDGRPIAEFSGKANQVIDKASEVRYFVKPKSHPKGTADYLVVDHPALRGWKWATSDLAGNPIFVQGDMLVHPEYAKNLQKILGPSKFDEHPSLRVAQDLSRGFKQTLLSLSPFHQVQIGVHALEHRVNPFRVPHLNLSDATQRALVNHGLVVANFHGMAQMSEGVTGSGVIKLIPILNERWAHYQDYLFRKYIPRIKMSMAMHALERNRGRYRGKLSEDQILALTARQANAAFGGLNYRLMARSKTFQDAFGLFALAPDFLEARARFVGQALKPGGKEQLTALAYGAISMAAGKAIIGQITGEQQDWDLKHLFYLRLGGREYGLRTIQGDIIHLITDPNSFVSNRINPAFMKPVLELGYGRDQYGRKRAKLQQLEDYFKTAVPIPFKGALPDQPQDFLSTLFQSTGIQSRRYISAAQMVIKDYYAENPSREPSDKTKALREVTNAAREGDMEKAQRLGVVAIRKGLVDEKDLNFAIEKARKGPLAASLRNVPWTVAVKAFEAATPEEKQQIGQFTAEKLARAMRNNPQEFTPEVMQKLQGLGFSF